jgi:hypothetical protein
VLDKRYFISDGSTTATQHGRARVTLTCMATFLGQHAHRGCRSYPTAARTCGFSRASNVEGKRKGNLKITALLGRGLLSRNLQAATICETANPTSDFLLGLGKTSHAKVPLNDFCTGTDWYITGSMFNSRMWNRLEDSLTLSRLELATRGASIGEACTSIRT